MELVPANAIPVDSLAPEEQEIVHGLVESAPPAGAFDPVDFFDTPQELAKLSIDTGGEFSPVRYAHSNPDIIKNSSKWAKLVDADAILRDRGFELEDIDLRKAAEGLWHMGKSFAFDRPKSALKMAKAGAEFVTAKDDSERFDAALKTGKEASQLVAASELSAFEFLNLFLTGAGKVKSVFSPPVSRPFEERERDFFKKLSKETQREKISSGRGALVDTLGGEGTAEFLETFGAGVDPEEVGKLSASDPLVFIAFPGGIKIAHVATGKVLATAASKTAAGKLVTSLRAAEKASLSAAQTEVKAVRGLEAAKAAPGAEGPLAAPALTEAGQAATAASQAAGVAEQGLVEARAAVAASPTAEFAVTAQKASDAVLGAVSRAPAQVVDVAAGLGTGAVGAGMRVAGWLGLKTAPVLPLVGAGVGLAKAGPIGGLAGLAAGETAKQTLKRVAKPLVEVGKKATDTAGMLLRRDTAAYPAGLRLATDVAKGGVDIAKSGARGFLLTDLPFAAVVSETPEETAHMPLFATALRAAGVGVPNAARRTVQGQLIASRNWTSDAHLQNYGKLNGLDEANKYSVENGDPGKANRLAALREFVEPSETQLYWVSDPKMFSDSIRRYFPGREELWYEDAAKQRGVIDWAVDDSGSRQKVAIFKDMGAAHHEATHAVHAVLGEQAMGKLYDAIYTEYLPIWEQLGEGYARKFYDEAALLDYARNGETWREAALDLTFGGRENWPSKFTPEQIEGLSNKYMADELVAETGDALLRHDGPDLLGNQLLPGKLARILAKTMVGLGLEPFEGVRSEGQDIPLRFETTEAVREALRTGIGEAKVEGSRPDVSGKAPVSPRTPVSPAGETGAVSEARAIAEAASDAPGPRGTRSPKQILTDIAGAIASKLGLKIDYRSAPGEPAGSISSNRETRRAVIEAFRDMPAESRALWEKTFFPDRVIKAGSKVQVMGWAPEVFASNAHKLAKALTAKKATDLSPYPIDPKTGSFTVDGWKSLYEDTATFVQNQQTGATGAGGQLVVPRSVTERGFFAPEKSGTPRVLDQGKADVISALFGIKIPETPRVGKVFPRNLAGQEVSEATQPGRTSVPVEPRAPFSGEKAAELGIEGREIREVNPFRAELDKRGIKPSFIEAIQRLNLDNIADVTGAPEVAQFRGSEFTLQAGFQPGKLMAPDEITRFINESKDGEEFNKFGFAYEGQFENGLTGMAYDLGAQLTTPAQLAELAGHRVAHQNAFRAAMTNKDLGAASLEGIKAQLFREAEEFARGVGSAAKAAEGVDLPLREGAGAQFQPRAETKMGKDLEKRGFLVQTRNTRPGYSENVLDVVVLQNDKDVAWVMSDIDPSKNTAKIADIIVQKSLRGQGIGEVLYRELASRLQELGITELFGDIYGDDIISSAPYRIRKKLFGSGSGSSENPSPIPSDSRFQPKEYDPEDYRSLSAAQKLNLQKGLFAELTHDNYPPVGTAHQPENSFAGTGFESPKELLEAVRIARPYDPAFYGVSEPYGAEAVARGKEHVQRLLDGIESGDPDVIAEFEAIKNRLRWKNGFYKEPRSFFGIKFQPSREDVIADYGDRLLRQREFLAGQSGAKSIKWDTVSAARLKKIWLDFGKSGVVRDEKGMQRIADQITDNVARLEVATELTGHSPVDPYETMEGYGLSRKQIDDLGNLLFDDDRLTDFAIEPLQKAVFDLGMARTAEDQLYAVDRILNIVHRRSDLASNFVEGGSKTLDEIAAQDFVPASVRGSNSVRTEYAPRFRRLDDDKPLLPENAGLGNFWMSPAGEFFRAGDHQEWAMARVTYDTPRGSDSRSAEQTLKETGWVQISRIRLLNHPAVFIDGSRRLNEKQQSAFDIWVGENPDVEIVDYQSLATRRLGGARFQVRRSEDDAKFQPPNKPDDDIRELAKTYVGKKNPDETWPGAGGLGATYREMEVKPEVAKRMADFYAAAKSDPDDPAVKASYKALGDETVSQYRDITAAGYKLEPFTGEGEPYKSSAEMFKDVRENKHLFFLPTGKAGTLSADNLMLADSGISGWPVNDVFRAVYDFFGHAKEGNQFGPKGEFNAWRSHSEMYSPEAQGALASETLAQNFWVNFGAHLRRGEAGDIPAKGQEGYVPPLERPFAEQKNIIVPAAMIAEIRGDGGSQPLTEAGRGLVTQGFDLSVDQSSPDSVSINIRRKGSNSVSGSLSAEVDRENGSARMLDVVLDEGLREQGIDGILAAELSKFLQEQGIIPERGEPLTEEQRVAAQFPRGAQFQPTMEEYERRQAAEAKRKPKKTPAGKPTFKMSPGSGGFSKAWILPNGEPVQLGGKWHHEWLNENAAIVADRWKIPLEDAKASDGKGSRESALKAGFARVNLGTNNGELTVELRARDLRRHKNPIYDFVQANAKAIDRITVHLLNEAASKVVDSGGESLFRYPAAEKADHIPFVTGEEASMRAQFQPRGETEGFPGLDIPREPLTPRDISQMTRADLRRRYPEAVVPRAIEETVPSEIVESPLYKDAATEAAAVDAFAARLVEFARENEDHPSYKAGLRWYSDFAPRLKKQFGKDANMMAELLAATSPNTNVQVNFAYAFDALKSFKDGRFKKLIPKFEEGLEKMADGSWEKWYDRELKAGNVKAPPENPTAASFLAHWIDKFDLKPKQSNGKLYGQHSVPVLQVLAKRWMDLNAGPKTRNFVENLLGKSNEATIDVWSDRTMRWAGYEAQQDRWRVLPQNSTGVSDADFAFSQKAFRKAADELGVKPSALQGALWFSEKQRWADNGWGRLDLGDFGRELDKLPLFESGYRSRRRAQEAGARRRPAEQSEMSIDVSPRYE